MARFQLDISDDKLKDIEIQMEKTGSATKREYMNNALTLTKWAIGHCESGRVIGAVDPSDGSYIELQMPFLSDISNAGSVSTDKGTTPKKRRA